MGSWDLYGVEDNKRYPGLQAEFFERAAAPLTRRSAVYSFLALSAPHSCLSLQDSRMRYLGSVMPSISWHP